MGRRGQGEGGVFKRERDGKWVARLDLGIKNGKRVRKEFVRKTRAEVVALHRKAQRKIDEGFDYTRDTKAMTVGQYLEHWLTEMVAKDRFVKKPRAMRTKMDYAEIVRLHLTPRLGGIRLNHLNESHIEKMLDDLKNLDNPLSPRRCEYIFAVLRNAFNNGIRAKIIQRNPCQFVEPIALPEKVITPFEVDEAKQLINVAKESTLDQLQVGSQLATMVTLAFNTGMRQGELLALTWADVELYSPPKIKILRKVFHIGSKRSGNLEYIFGAPKSIASNRTLWLPPTTVKALEAHREQQALVKKEAGEYWEGGKEYKWEDGTPYYLPDDLIFTTPLGGPIYNSNVVTAFRRLVAEAETRKESFHKMRHSSASFWSEAGFTSFDIGAFLGHASPHFTAKTYQHLLNRSSQRGAEAMEQIMGTPTAQEESPEGVTNAN